MGPGTDEVQPRDARITIVRPEPRTLNQGGSNRECRALVGGQIALEVLCSSVLASFGRSRYGTYGISAYHDEDKNGKLDTNVVGMPIEDYCASRDARGTFSAPSFEDAKFEYKGSKLRMSAQSK
jgi:uncharacterized protein (DUF2141 family)